jgi:ribosomal-protein-alanine N-acetyltransferase
LLVGGLFVERKCYLPALMQMVDPHKNPLSFETERLLLRPTHLEDVAFLLALTNTPKWLKFIGDRGIHSEEDAAQYIADRILPQLEQRGFGNYTVIRKTDGVKLGTCGLYDRQGLEGLDIGFAFLPAYEGQGYGFESAHRLLQAAWETFDLPMVQAVTLEANTASRKLISKLGLQFVEWIRLADDPQELLLYRILRPETPLLPD